MNVFDAIYLNENDSLERSFIAAETALDIAVARATKEYTLESGLIELSDDKLFIESEGNPSDSKRENAFVKAVKAVCNAIRKFIGDLFSSIMSIFNGRENITPEDYLASTTGKMRLEKDTEKLEKIVDEEIRKGNKLLQQISSKTGVEDDVVDSYIRTGVEKIEKLAPVVIPVLLGFGFKKIFGKLKDKKKSVDTAEKAATTGDNSDSKKNKQKLKVFSHMKSMLGQLGKGCANLAKQLRDNAKTGIETMKHNHEVKSNLKKIGKGQTGKVFDTWDADEFDQNKTESVSLFGVDIASDSIFMESDDPTIVNEQEE